MPVTTLPRLIESDWLAEHLGDPDLRIIDCTFLLSRDPETGAYREESGRARWEQGHIPGAAFVDVATELSETDSPRFRFQLPSESQVAATMSRLGVGDDSHVVLYDSGMNMWAARVWWLLSA